MKDEPGDRDSASLEEVDPRMSTVKFFTPARVLVAHSSRPGCCSGLMLSDTGFSPFCSSQILVSFTLGKA